MAPLNPSLTSPLRALYPQASQLQTDLNNKSKYGFARKKQKD